MPSFSPYAPAVLVFYFLAPLLMVLLTWGAAYISSTQQRMRLTRLVALGGLAWLMLTWRVAASGILRRWDATPPPLFILMIAVIAIAVALVFSPFGKRLAFGIPLWVLIAVQAFRLPLEVAMHGLVGMGVMPNQMSYSGRNFDIVTGVTAVVVALAIRSGRAGPTTARVWNVMGVALLANVLIIAILSTPRFRFFGPDRVNVFVTYPPFVWLPTVMVLFALAGHLLIFRRLFGQTR